MMVKGQQFPQEKSGKFPIIPKSEWVGSCWEKSPLLNHITTNTRRGNSPNWPWKMNSFFTASTKNPPKNPLEIQRMNHVPQVSPTSVRYQRFQRYLQEAFSPEARGSHRASHMCSCVCDMLLFSCTFLGGETGRNHVAIFTWGHQEIYGKSRKVLKSCAIFVRKHVPQLKNFTLFFGKKTCRCPKRRL